MIASVIVPIFALMALGYWMARRGVVSAATAKQINTLTFRYLISTQLFLNIYQSSLSEAINGKLTACTAIGILAAYALLVLVMPKFFPDRRKRVPMIQAMFRSNHAIFGLVFVTGFYPEQAAVPSVLSAVVIPMYAVLAVITLEKGGAGKATVKGTLLNVLKNPLFVAAVLGVAANASGLVIPEIPMKILKDVGGIGNPLALMAIGMGFELKSIRGNGKEVLVTCVWRLLVLPLIMTGVGILVGLRDVELMSLLVVFGAPVAVSSYTMAVQYDVDHGLANLLVVASTLACCVTLFLLLLLFSHTPFLVF